MAPLGLALVLVLPSIRGDEYEATNRPAAAVVRDRSDAVIERLALADLRPSPSPVPVLASEPGDAGGETPAPVDEAAPTPGATDNPPPLYTPVLNLNDIELVICSAGWPDCAKALRVARCESGPDYWAPAGTYHVGTFQIAYLHAWRFAAHGWDIWVDGTDVYRNSVVAFEIYQESGWRPWPVCGYR